MQIKMKSLIHIVCLLLLLSSCNEEKQSELPLLHTKDVSDITEEGAWFSARVINDYESNVIEYGFVWSNQENPVIEKDEKYVIYETFNGGDFGQQITTSLKKGEIYYMRSYMQTKSALIYGNQVEFVSKGSRAPVIVDFNPKRGNLNDTVIITGQNFSYVLINNIVKFNSSYARILKVTQDTIITLVPRWLSGVKSDLSVTVLDNKAIADDQFELILPEIQDFTPKKGNFETLVAIKCKNLSNTNSLKVFFDDFEADIIDVSAEQIVVNVPDDLNKTSSEIRVEMNGFPVTAAERFELLPVKLSQFFPKVAITGNTIVIQGENFSPLPQNNFVYLGDIQAEVLKASSDEIEIKLPLQDEVIYPSRSVTITVEVAEEKPTFDDNLMINDQWFRLNNAPEELFSSNLGYSDVYCFSDENKAYLGLNDSNIFFEYDPIQDSWKKLRDFPGESRFYGVGFVIDNNVFFGTGISTYPKRVYYKDWWKYNIQDNTWTQLKDFKGKERCAAIAYTAGNIGYIGTGSGSGIIEYFTDVWMYDEVIDDWSMVADYPKEMFSGVALSVGTSAYVGLGRCFATDVNYMYQYNSENDSWSKLPDFPQGGEDNRSIGFDIDGQIYVSIGYWNPFYCYKESSKWWTSVEQPNFFDNRDAIAFSLNGKGYVGLGMKNWMWEYDPSR